MDPVVAQKAPAPVNEEPVARWWCACGRAASQPYCDGSHRGTGITPVRVEIASAGAAWYCVGKAAASQPRSERGHGRL